MGLSRSTRITILLVIDVLFFFVEIVVGYIVGSLALVADSFHMLNDIVSLVVALYAIKLTARSPSDSRYSYGWHRAEILAALVNGVFLLALCFSIALEALQRFVHPPEILNPRLVVIVGCLGLASNIGGLLLFHEHGHGHSHSHEHAHDPSSALNLAEAATLPVPGPRRSNSMSSLYGHPAATRASIVQAANDMAAGPSSISIHSRESTRRPSEPRGVERQTSGVQDVHHRPVESKASHEDQHEHHDHDHSGHSHSGSMNMRALVLHVFGDALGNIGVISAGLIIWLSSWSFKEYFDPIISLVITVIIFFSAFPLVRSTCYILLQRAPPTISVDAVRRSILAVDGVLSLHELHIWQLSESKNVASVHVMASHAHDFMPIAGKIRKVLHLHGIHSSTIQPEYHSQQGREGAETPVSTEFSGSNSSCLILCPDDQKCKPENACCPPPLIDV
ncbi:hypothetical protein HGRIS_014416 [Hohenbuehelia grisea]|uniref:Cation efflux protein n=1 Tax=Hohenbuehelia grisea TaxID=104357 RepID=A0ABR3JUB7_9AGAR